MPLLPPMAGHLDCISLFHPFVDPGRLTMKSLAQTFRRFVVTDERGTIAVMFGLISFMMFMFVGIAVDLSRIYHSDARLASAVDAAALAAGRAMLDGQLEDSEIHTMAREYIDNNYSGGGGENFGTVSIPDVNIELDRADSSVKISALLSVPMTFTKIAGFEKVDIPIDSTVRYEQQDIELGMQLDLTGSMCSPCSKRDALKSATKDLIDILIPDIPGSNKVRIGFAPYASGINLGTYAAQATNNRAGSSNCVYDRAGAQATTDAEPGTNAFYKGKLDLPSAGACPSARLMPLTDDKDALKTAVNGFTTSTTTAGQVGTSWAWNLISPKWASVWPSASTPVAYNDGKTIKSVILMTDGEYNTFEGRCDSGGCTPYGTRGTTSNNNAKSMCTNMKTEGVVVFTVGFQINHPKAIETLGNCASSPEHYFQAENSDELRAAFVAIAQQINNLRLTQ